jgi:hypothetical protein
MIQVKTESGFYVELEDDVMDDWSILKMLRKIDKGEHQVIVDLAPALLGEENEERLETHLVNLHGRCKVTDMVQEITQIINASKLKN